VTAHTDSTPRVANRLVIAVVLVTVIGVAWWQTAQDAGRMGDMLDGLAKAGRAMPFDSRPATFAGRWTVMMAAMMLPGVVPAAVASRADERPHSSTVAALASGYIVVWIAAGVVAFGSLIALNSVGEPGGWPARAGGALVVFAGAYQFSGWKRRLLERNRERGQITSGSGVFGGAFGVGLSHGLRCVGASWALMAVLLVVGVMNVAWMAVIGAICFGEKVSTHRAALATGVGLALVALGLVVLAEPRMLGVIAGIG
jgi:predicted metal-binding membrane protein